VVVGCGGVSGEPDSGWTFFDEPSGEYRVFYLEPPWEFVAHEDGVTRLRVAPNGRVMDGGPRADDKYGLEIRQAGRDAQDMANRAIGEAEAQGREILEEPRELQTRQGHIGWEIVTRANVAPVRYQRRVWIERIGGGSWSLDFAATPDPRGLEMDHMIELFMLEPEDPGVEP